MNSDFFNINRFGRYLVTDIRNAIARYGISLLVMASISFAGYLLAGFFSMFLGQGWYSMNLVYRITLFVISAVVILISSPSKIYGFFTDKKEGSSFLTMPVSTMERTVSMVIVCCIAVPFAFLAIYLSLDQIVCLLDRSCGESIIMAVNDGQNYLSNVMGKMYSDIGSVMPDFEDIKAFSNPWLYYDDMAGSLLIFLLGALWFKSSKPAKTIGFMILFSIVLSMLLTPILTHGVLERFQEAANSGMSPEELMDSFPLITWMVKHAVLTDTLSDTFVNVLLFVLIWLRVKKMEH